MHMEEAFVTVSVVLCRKVSVVLCRKVSSKKDLPKEMLMERLLWQFRSYFAGKFRTCHWNGNEEGFCDTLAGTFKGSFPQREGFANEIEEEKGFCDILGLKFRTLDQKWYPFSGLGPNTTNGFNHGASGSPAQLRTRSLYSGAPLTRAVKQDPYRRSGFLKVRCRGRPDGDSWHGDPSASSSSTGADTLEGTCQRSKVD